MTRVLILSLASVLAGSSLAESCGGGGTDESTIKVRLLWSDGSPQGGVTIFATGLAGGDQTEVTDANGEVTFTAVSGLADVTAYWSYVDENADPSTLRTYQVLRTVNAVSPGEEVTLWYYNPVVLKEQLSAVSGQVTGADTAMPDTELCMSVLSPMWSAQTREAIGVEVDFQLDALQSPGSVAFAAQVSSVDVRAQGCYAMPVRMGFLPSVAASGNTIDLDIPMDATISIAMSNIDDEMLATEHGESILVDSGEELFVGERGSVFDDPDSGLLHVPPSMAPFGGARLRVYATAVGEDSQQMRSVTLDEPDDVSVTLPELPDVQLDLEAFRDGDPMGETVGFVATEPAVIYSVVHQAKASVEGDARYVYWSVLHRDGEVAGVSFPKVPLPRGALAFPEGYQEDYTIVRAASYEGEEEEIETHYVGGGEEPDSMGTSIRLVYTMP